MCIGSARLPQPLRAQLGMELALLSPHPIPKQNLEDPGRTPLCPIHAQLTPCKTRRVAGGKRKARCPPRIGTVPSSRLPMQAPERTLSSDSPGRGSIPGPAGGPQSPALTGRQRRADPGLEVSRSPGAGAARAGAGRRKRAGPAAVCNLSQLDPDGGHLSWCSYAHGMTSRGLGAGRNRSGPGGTGGGDGAGQGAHTQAIFPSSCSSLPPSCFPAGSDEARGRFRGGFRRHGCKQTRRLCPPALALVPSATGQYGNAQGDDLGPSLPLPRRVAFTTHGLEPGLCSRREQLPAQTRRGASCVLPQA